MRLEIKIWVEFIDTREQLPEIGEADVLYWDLSEQEEDVIYFWDNSEYKRFTGPRPQRPPRR